MGNSLDERLRHVIGVNVMERLHANIRQGDLFPAGKACEDVGIKIACGVDRDPARSHDVTGLQHARRKATSACLIQQIILNGVLLDAVLAEGASRCVFGGRNFNTMPKDPNGPAMQEVLHLFAESTNELLRALKSETYQINDDVGFQLKDTPGEHAGGVLSSPVGRHLLNEAPGRIGFIWFPLGARNIDHLVLCPNKTRHKVGSNVSTSSNDDNTHPYSLSRDMRRLVIDVKFLVNFSPMMFTRHQPNTG